MDRRRAMITRDHFYFSFYIPSHACTSIRRYFIYLLYSILSFEFAVWCCQCHCHYFYSILVSTISFFCKESAQRFLFLGSIYLCSNIFSYLEKYKNFGSPICCQNSFYYLIQCIFGWWWPLSFPKAHKFHTDKKKWKTKENMCTMWAYHPSVHPKVLDSSFFSGWSFFSWYHVKLNSK